MTTSGPGAGLLGRRDECAALDALIEGARVGRSAALVLRGEAGIGKTELLGYALDRASGCRTVRAAGVQSEMELSYAGLHQLCGPLLAGLDDLPAPQHDALATAFGLRSGDAPDRFLVGLATLSLLADAGGRRPLVCVVDDAQWLDQASALTLGFVARRLLAESTVLLFAVREPTAGEMLADLPELRVSGLSERASRDLLLSVVRGPLDDRVRDRILAEARGNPLALLELPRGITAEVASGFVGPEDELLANQLEQGFARRIELLPAETRRLMVAAAADPLGDVRLLRRSAERLGIDVEAAVAHADATELITLGTQVRFRHPLVRSAVYRAASRSDRQEAHGALAEAIDADSDPDRRAWHRAHATPGPDEDVAVELERSAERAQARGGIAAVAAFLERAAELTHDPVRRAQRALQAAQAHLQAGAFEPAAALLAMAEAGPPDPLRLATTERLHAGIAFALGRGNQTPPLLLAAARRLEQVDVAMARETYLEAVSSVIFAGHLAGRPGHLEVGAAARRAPAAPQPGPADELLDALAVRLTEGYDASAALIEQALTAFSDETIPVGGARRWLLLAGVIAADLWDHERWQLVAARQVTSTREAGALSELPLALDSLATTYTFAGDLATAAALVEEVRTLSTAIGANQPPFGAMALAAVRGDEREARGLIEATLGEAVPHGQGQVAAAAHFHHAVLCNGLARYEEAIAAAQGTTRHQQDFGTPRWGLAELIEAAVRSGSTALAAEALEELTRSTQVIGSDWALGVEARSRALLSDGDVAETLYREALERLSRTGVRLALARAHLVYGEWLRKEARRDDARTQLGTAHALLTEIGAGGFAERAGRELRATGATVRPPTTTAPTALTVQEDQIAQLAANGLTNAEIGARLFLSPHTVDWHLRKVFAKLSISSRTHIAARLRLGSA